MRARVRLLCWVVLAWHGESKLAGGLEACVLRFGAALEAETQLRSAGHTPRALQQACFHHAMPGMLKSARVLTPTLSTSMPSTSTPGMLKSGPCACARAARRGASRCEPAGRATGHPTRRLCAQYTCTQQQVVASALILSPDRVGLRGIREGMHLLQPAGVVGFMSHPVAVLPHCCSKRGASCGLGL